MTIGSTIHALRNAAGLSQEELAGQLGVSRQAVSKWELGKATPDTASIVALSELFHVSTDTLLKGAAPPAAAPEPVPEPAPAPPSSAALPVMAAVTVLLAGADLLYLTAHLFSVSALLSGALLLLISALLALPALLAAARLQDRLAGQRRLVAAGARLWCFGVMLLCGFHEFLGDVLVDGVSFGSAGEIILVCAVFAAVILGLWLAGRLAVSLLTPDTKCHPRRSSKN